MKKYYLILLGILLIGCEKEEITEVAALEAPTEYFNAEIDGKEFTVTDPETIGGMVYLSPNQVRTFDFWGATGTEDDHESITFMICFFEGPGTYYPGNDYNNSYGDYWLSWHLWSTAYPHMEPGEVIVTEQTEDFVEGTFKITGYNDEDDSYVEIQGEFGVLLEESF